MIAVCRIIAVAFSSDKSFHNVLNTAFEHFLNLSPRAPEYISLFMDDQLRKVHPVKPASPKLPFRGCAPTGCLRSLAGLHVLCNTLDVILEHTNVILLTAVL